MKIPDLLPLALRNDFTAVGLVLQSLAAVVNLPESVWLNTPDKQPPYGALLLLGHGGRLFWEVYRNSESSSEHPVDNYSATISADLLDQHLPGVKRKLLFPETDCPINLLALGKVLGWHTPSRLGLGIHREYGLWSAYRALWWLDIDVSTAAITTATTGTSASANNGAADLCADCATQDCVTACPAQAISPNASPDMNRCANFRLQDNSHCASTCWARMACPVAPQHRYTPEQMAYHYDLSRSLLYRYYSAVPGSSR